MPVNLDRMDFTPAVIALTTCVCEAFVSAGSPLCSCCLSIGQPSDVFCDCACGDGTGGQLTVYPSPIGPSRSFPQLAIGDPQMDHACGPPYLVLPLNFEISRCVSSLGDETGDLPTCDERAADALAWYRDVNIIRQAVGCCLTDLKAAGTIERFSIGLSAPKPEAGGCAGSVTQVMIALKHCVCPSA